MSDDIRPFRIDVPEAELDDLHDRLRRTRWPEPEPVDDWSQGTPLAYTRELCDYWRSDYDWRAGEARLNRFAQFRTEIDGVDIHFIHVRSAVHPATDHRLRPGRLPRPAVRLDRGEVLVVDRLRR